MKKKCIKLITVLLVVMILVGYILYYFYMNSFERYDYEELPGGIEVIYGEEGVDFAIEISSPIKIEIDGMIGNENHQIETGDLITIPGMTLLYMDEATGYPCYRKYIYFEIQRKTLKEPPVYRTLAPLHCTYEGIQGGFVEAERRIVELCYLNKDGSTVMLWKRDQ